MDYSAIFWIGWGLALLVLVPHVWGWWRTVVLFRGIDSTRIRQMLHLCRFTGHLRILVLSLAMLVALFTPILILGAPVPLGVTAVMAAVALVPLLRLTLPPAILFLAGSGERGNVLLFRLHRSASPLRVVALLDHHRMGVLGQMIRLDLMRTTTENMWKSMVHRLMDIAPVIVIDTVQRTGPCRYEAFLVSAPERAGRTVFISDEEGRCPSLEAEGIDPSEFGIPVIRADDMEEAVLHLLQVPITQLKGETAPPRGVIPISPDTWESLPSVLMIGLVDVLDGGFLLTQARNTEQSLIALLVPLSSLDEDAATASTELLWEFSRNPRLVGLYLQDTGLAMVRRDFLLQYPELLDVHVVPPQRMTLEDLNRPEPIGAAVHELCVAWRQAAQRRGLEFRLARK
jgi:hypothetical protein